MPESQVNSLTDLVGQAREKMQSELRAQAEQIDRLQQALEELRQRHAQVEQTVRQEFEALAGVETGGAGGEALEKVLGAVRNLITSTFPEQVLETLTEEAQHLGVRAAVFDVRGKSAWGSCGRGFSGLNDKAFRALIVPLNQDNIFRHCYETGGHVDATAEMLKRIRNVSEKFRPDASDAILLLPVRSAGAVSAIFYADAGGTGQPLPADGLKILAEFAGAQLDRLMALSGGIAAPPAPPEAAEAEVAETVEEEARPVEVEAEAEPVSAPLEAAAAAAAEAAPAAPEPPPAPPAPAGPDLSQLSEAEQKAHRDAKRFARLLVSEIELYNKAKVAEGRKNKDLYKRLKTDIERSRQTYEKRFGKSLGKEFDYFHEELIKTLASNDASLLGSDYPGTAA